MAITPEKWSELRNKINEAEVTAFETRIDKELLNAAIGQTTISVTLNAPNPVVREIMRRYTEVGWNVTFHSDQRDGDWLEFSPAYRNGGKIINKP
jgi:hypothetical protein